MEKVNKKTEELKNKFKFSRVKQVLRDPELVSYLNILQEQYIMCPIDKAANNIALCPSTHKRIRFIKCYIKHLSTSE